MLVALESSTAVGQRKFIEGVEMQGTATTIKTFLGSMSGREGER